MDICGRKKILLGMVEEFYIRFQGSCEKYDMIGTMNSDPDIIRYEESGFVNVHWKVRVVCH